MRSYAIRQSVASACRRNAVRRHSSSSSATNGLGHAADNARLQGLRPYALIGVSRHQDRRNRPARCLLLLQLKPAHARHADVDDDLGRTCGVRRIGGSSGRKRVFPPESPPTCGGLSRIANRFVVVDRNCGLVRQLGLTSARLGVKPKARIGAMRWRLILQERTSRARPRLYDSYDWASLLRPLNRAGRPFVPARDVTSRASCA